MNFLMYPSMLSHPLQSNTNSGKQVELGTTHVHQGCLVIL
jgi:hypothetical protein